MAFRDGDRWVLTQGDPGHAEGFMFDDDYQASLKEQFEKEAISQEEILAALQGTPAVGTPEYQGDMLLPPAPLTPADPDLAAALFASFMVAMGLDVNDPHLEGTPQRVVKMYQECMMGDKLFDFTTFPEDGFGDQMITLRGIPFTSFCAHHLMPFTGVATVAYIPRKNIGGLSKFARTVGLFAGRPQVQERLGKQIAFHLMRKMGTPDVAVTLDARHSCMELRGPKAVGSIMRTTVLRGAFKANAETRAEYFAQIKGLE